MAKNGSPVSDHRRQIMGEVVILARLDYLENRIRRLKAAALTIMILAASVFIMAARRNAAGQGAVTTVEAAKFVLRDSEGRMRASLEVEHSGPSLDFYDIRGRVIASLRERAGGSNLALFGQDVTFTMGTMPDSRVTIVSHSDDVRSSGRATLSLGDPIRDGEWNYALLSADGQGTTLRIQDRKHYATTIGASSLVVPLTGENHVTSAASIVLYGKNGNVLWQAPR
jgi:hypothetical protein